MAMLPGFLHTLSNMHSLSDAVQSLTSRLSSVNQLVLNSWLKSMPTNLTSPTEVLTRFFVQTPTPFKVRKYLYEGDASSGRTFALDDDLPSLPLPALHDTLEAYLDSCKPHLSEEELVKLEATLVVFEKGIGGELQKKLQSKAETSRNWLEKWWEEEVYLKYRLPLIPYLYMCAVGPMPSQFTEDFDFKEISMRIHYMVRFWLLLHEEKLKPQKMAVRRDGKQELKPLSMHQYRRLWNTVRVPKEGMDEVACYFTTQHEAGVKCPSNVIVLYRGYVYSIDAANLEAGDIMAPDAIEHALTWIINDARCKESAGPAIAALTCDNRDTWAKNRLHLLEIDPSKNGPLLQEIESSIFYVTLSDEMHFAESDVLKRLVCDEIADRWADKSSGCTMYRNGCIGHTSEHTPIDGIVNASLAHYISLSCEIAAADQGKDYERYQSPKQPWSNPRQMDFTIDDRLLEEVGRVLKENEMLRSQVNCKALRFAEFGKGVLKVYRAHPDAFMQTALQLAYYRMHGRPGSAYETATTRQFYHGRTETCRTCSAEATDFVKSMDDPNMEENERWRLLKKVLAKHQDLMRKSWENMGCDRHMFGLQMAAAENAMDDPALQEIFGPGPWTKSGGSGQFALSTSLLGYNGMLGGMIAMCRDGYGAFYSIEDDKIHIGMSTWVGGESDINAFATALVESLIQMERLAAHNYSSN